MNSFTPRRQDRQANLVEPPAEVDRIASVIVDSAFFVHKAMGPGLLESVYEICLAEELQDRGLQVERQKAVPVTYKGKLLDAGFRADMLVNNQVIVEIKSIERLGKLHEAQLLTYLKFTGHSLGLLVNFNVPLIKDGIRRFCYTAH